MTRDEILTYVIAEATGFDVEALGEAAFTRSVEALMVRRGMASHDEYAAALRGSAAELQNLVEELVVPETWFFRDRGPFEFLRDWARSAPHRLLRVLSVPCSTGEEPYSIAITLLEAGLAPERFSIDAVDVSQRAIDVAVHGVYGKSSFRETWGGYRDYFTAVENGFALRNEIARLVEFHCDNLVHPSFLLNQNPYDAVFCRNLLIYLNADARRAVLRNIERLLVPDGVLVVGASELPAFVQNGYTAVSHPYSFACQKGSAAPVPDPLPHDRGSETCREHEDATPTRALCREYAHAIPSRARQQAAAAPSSAAAPLGERLLDTAWRLADEGALEQASQVCDKLLAAAPARTEHYYLKGLLSEAMDRLDTAEEFFRKALYLDPDHYPALLHMSALCERRGEPSRGDLFRARARRIAGRGVELHEPRH